MDASSSSTQQSDPCGGPASPERIIEPIDNPTSAEVNDDPDAHKLATQVLGAIAARRRGIATGFAVALVGCAAAAFGIAPQAPDVADLPKRTLTETIATEPLAPQLEALESHDLLLYRNDTTRISDTADSLLRRLGADDPVAAFYLRNDRVARKLLEGRAGKMIQAQVDADGKLMSLIGRFPAERSAQVATHFSRLTVERGPAGLTSKLEVAPLISQLRLGSGSIRSTLFAATDEARIPDFVASQMVELFSTDIDFHREMRRGDSFSVAYEAMTADGEAITWAQSSGRVLAAEFVNDGHRYSALWFTGSTGKGSYYGLDGQSKRRAFLSSPLEFSRVTSGFSMRMHPILQIWRQHLGVDYAAPSGTPVRSVGDAVVVFAGWQNGYGNKVELEHDGKHSTIYAHLSRIDVRKGQHVDQGQTLGAVGATGWATGPHLHFEFKVNGEQRDPLIMAKASEAVPIAPADRPRFAELAGSLRAQLDAVGSALGAGQAE